MKLIKTPNEFYYLLIEGKLQSVDMFNISQEDCDILTQGYSIKHEASCFSKAFDEDFIKGFEFAERKFKKKLEHLYNLLTYDDLDEDEKTKACKEYIENLLTPKTEWDVKFDKEKCQLLLI